MNPTDPILGCILGGAIGDVSGLPYENRWTPPDLTDYYPWQTSDDTQLTLATCEAITACDGAVDPAAIAARFAEWHRRRRVTGMGISTLKALQELVQGAHWALVGRKGEMAAGNGAAMRIAPLAFCLDPNEETARQTIRDVSRITHHNDEAYAGALAIVVAVRVAWDGSWNGGPGLLRRVIAALPDTRVRDRVIELSKLDAQVPLREVGTQFGCSGYVVNSIPFALCGAERVPALDFTSLLREIIAAGRDTDSNASMAGQIAGTLLGRQALPPNLLKRVPDLPEVERIANDFASCIVACRNEPGTNAPERGREASQAQAYSSHEPS